MKLQIYKFLFPIFLLLPSICFGQSAHSDAMEKSLGQLRIYYRNHNDSLATFLETAKQSATLEKDYAALVEIYKIKGAFQFLAGDFSEAFSSYAEGIKIGEVHKVENELISIYYELAGVLSKSSKSNNELAMQYINKGLAFAQKLKDTTGLADGNNRIGIMMEKKGNLDSALFFYSTSYQYNKLKNDSVGISYSLENLAGVYGQQKRYPLAIEKMKESMQLRLLKNDMYGIAMANINLSEIYQESKQIDSAIKYAHLAELAGKKVAFIDLLQFTYEHMCNLYKEKNRYDIALEYHEKFANLKDSIFNAHSAKNINELSAKFESEKKMQQIKVLNKQKTISSLGMFVSLLLLIIMIIVAYTIYKNRKLKEEKLRTEATFSLQLQEVEARNALQQERLRISRELHDNIGAHLTFINATVENGVNDPQKMQQVKDLTNDTIRELRKTVWLINKSTVRVEEFVLKLKDFLKNIPTLQVLADIQNPDLLLKAEQITELFRACQESVNNALKYAAANRILIQIKSDHQKIEIFIQDDGKGFSLSEKMNNGFGLENMQIRMENIGGTYEITSEIGKGTSIKLTSAFS